VVGHPLVAVHEAAEDGDAGGDDGEGGLGVSPDPEVNRVGCILLAGVGESGQDVGGWYMDRGGSAPKSGESMAGNLAVLTMPIIPALDKI